MPAIEEGALAKHDLAATKLSLQTNFHEHSGLVSQAVLVEHKLHCKTTIRSSLRSALLQ
jgi:hypothetical protein